MRFLLLLVAVLLACLWGGDSAKRGRKQLKVKPTQSGDGSWYRVVVQEDGSDLTPRLDPSPSAADLSGLDARMLLTDYLRSDRNPQVPRLKRTWSRVREWVEGTGIQFWYNSVRKPDGTAASQIGNSCGIVAARVTTLLRDRPNTEDLYEYPTTSATEFQ